MGKNSHITSADIYTRDGSAHKNMTKAKYLSLKGTSRGSPLTNLNTHPSIPSSVYNVAMGDVMNRARYGVKKAAKEVL